MKEIIFFDWKGNQWVILRQNCELFKAVIYICFGKLLLFDECKTQ